MDPLSLTASILTVLAAGGSVVGGLEKLSSLREAPDMILALNNEISDFRLVVFELANYLRDQPTQSSANVQTFADNIPPMLDRARDKLIELESLIEYKLILPRNDGSIRLNKTSWIWERQKVKRILEDVRSMRMNLVAVTGVLISKSTLRLELQMSDFRSSNDASHNALGQSLTTAVNTSSTTENLLGQLLSTVAQNQTRTESQIRDALAASATLTTDSSSSSRAQSAQVEEIATSGRAFEHRSFYISSTLQWQYLVCIPSCKCRCHNVSRWATPKWLNPLLGRLFAGYAGLPVLTESCATTSCQRRLEPSISLCYYFPFWFAQRVLQAYLYFPYHGGIEQRLRVSRIIWSGSDIFLKAMSGDAEGVKALLSSREISPFDVDTTYNHTALALAVQYGHAEVSRALLQEGADPFHRNLSGVTAIQSMWTRILGNEYDAHISETMQSIMPAYELDEFGFSILHEAVLGLKPVTIEEALERHPQWTVNEEDSYGRTPLSWAAQRRDHDAMRLLLRNNADPHKTDSYQRSSIYWAMRGGSVHCVRLLLEHGININQIDVWGATPLIQLGLAPNQDDMKLLDLLLHYKADVDYRGPEGDSTLLVLLQHQNYSAATRLIHYGANIHITENSGYNALSMAVLYNAHSIIRLLLSRQADHRGNIKPHGSFFHLVAATADLETLQILTNPGSNLATREVQVRNDDGRTALEVAQSRNDTSLEWQNAFYAFLWSVDVTKSRVSPFGTRPLGSEGARVNGSDEENDVFVDALE